MDSPSDCTLWGWKMDLLRDPSFTLLLHLSSLFRSLTLWGAHSPTQVFFFFHGCSAKKQRGGPGRVNSVSSSISRSSDFQSEIPGVGWGHCYRQEPCLTDYPRPTEIPRGILLCIQLMEGQCYGGIMVPDIAPDYVRFSSLPLKVRGNSLILRLVVQYFSNRNPSGFPPHIFSNISLGVLPLLIYWHVSHLEQKLFLYEALYLIPYKQ